MSNTINGGYARGCGQMVLFILAALLLLAGAALAFATEPRQDVLREQVDAIECNSLYSYCEENDTYSLTFSQLIFRKWDWQAGTHVIEAWRMQRTQGDTKDKIEVRYNRNTGMYEATWFDGNALHVVSSRSYYETASDYDVEVSERNNLPVHLRRELRK